MYLSDFLFGIYKFFLQNNVTSAIIFLEHLNNSQIKAKLLKNNDAKPWV